MAGGKRPCRSRWRRALVGFGSNLGDRAAFLAAGVAALGRDGGILVKAVSSLYRTSPVGCVRQPWYYNCAASLATRHSAVSLVGILLGVERRLGRRRAGRGAARVIDLDLLAMEGDPVARTGAIVPHPRMHERAFVLRPCAEIAPDFVHSALGLSVGSLLAGLSTGERVSRLPASVQRRFRRLVSVFSRSSDPHRRPARGKAHS